MGVKRPAYRNSGAIQILTPVEFHAVCSAKFSYCIELLEVLFVMLKVPGPEPDTHSSEQEALMFSSAFLAKCCDINAIQAAVSSHRIIPHHNSQRFNHTSLYYDLAFSKG